MIHSPSPIVLRAKRKPSPRNVQIYEAVRLTGERQADVAARHGLSQRRVSAICQQVDQWQRWASTAPNFEELQAQERRTALLQARHRCEKLLLAALKQAVRKQERLVSEVRRVVGGQEVVERTVRELPINPGWPKFAGSTSRDILRFTEQLGPDVEPSQTLAEVDALLAALGAEEERESGSGGAGETSLAANDSSKPDEGANYSSCSKTYGVSGSNGAPVSAAPMVEKHCADETSGDISDGEGCENRDEKNVRFIAAKVFYDENPAAPPKSDAPPTKLFTSDSQAKLPREVRERRVKFLRG